MLSPDVKIVDIDPAHWCNLVKLFDSGEMNRGMLLVFEKDGQCVKAIHTKRGAILDFVLPEKEHWDAMLDELDAERMGVMSVDLLRRFIYEAQSSFIREDDWDHQMMMLIEVLKPFIREEIAWHPTGPNKIATLDPEKIDAAIDKFWPDGRCVGFFVFDGDAPYTSVILGKDKGKIDLFTTLDAFGMAQTPIDWKAQAKHIAELCASKYSPLHGALWIELSSLREMMRGEKKIGYLRLAQTRGRAALWPAPLKWRLALWLARVFRGL